MADKNITTVNEISSVDDSDKVFVNDGNTLKQITVTNLMKKAPASSGGGTTDYNDLSNKPQLNGVTLEGNKTLDQVGVLAKNQGSSNSGKYLSVGSDGNVVPADAPSGGTVDPEQIKQAVNGYLEENPVSGMTEEQEQQLNQNTTDVADLKSEIGNLDLLETTNNGDLVSAINEANQNSSGGLTDEIKQALLQIASKVAYVDEDGKTYYDYLRYALYGDELFEGSMYITVANETLKEGYIDDNGDFISAANNHLINRMVKALPFCVANAGTLVTAFPSGDISLRSAYYDSNNSFLSRDYAQQPFKMVEDPSAIYQKVGWYDPTETFNVSYIILLNEAGKTLFTNSNVSIDTSGDLSFESEFHATDLIRIPSGYDKYVLYSSNTLSVNKIAFYDSDKTFILREYTGVTNNNLSKYGDIPMNAVYYRMSKRATGTMYNAVMKET